MTNPEFSNEFDVLYNNIMSNAAPGLDEYEKSVFLTKAQDEIIKAYFNPRTNKTQEGFDDSQKRQIDFSMLITVDAIQHFDQGIFDDRAKHALLQDNIMFILNEYVIVTRDEKEHRLTVLPINFQEYDRLMSKPYKRPLKNQAWRLLQNNNSNQAELIIGPNDTIVSYSYRYIRRPKAIILQDLEGVTLDNSAEEQPCELDPILHQEILQRAVELAKAAYTGDLNSQIALGVNSQTNLGMVASR